MKSLLHFWWGMPLLPIMSDKPVFFLEFVKMAKKQFTQIEIPEHVCHMQDTLRWLYISIYNIYAVEPTYVTNYPAVTKHVGMDS